MTLHRSLIATTVITLGIVSGCSGSQSSAGSRPSAPADSLGNPATTIEADLPANGDESDDATDPANGFTSDDLGTGWVMVGSDRRDVTRGQCEFSRFDGDEVVDLLDDEVTMVVGVDNSDGTPEGGPDVFGFTASRSGFTLRGSLDARGTWDSVVEVSDPRAQHIRDTARITMVGFTGTAPGGTPVASELICLVSW